MIFLFIFCYFLHHPKNSLKSTYKIPPKVSFHITMINRTLISHISIIYDVIYHNSKLLTINLLWRQSYLPILLFICKLNGLVNVRWRKLLSKLRRIILNLPPFLRLRWRLEIDRNLIEWCRYPSIDSRTNRSRHHLPNLLQVRPQCCHLLDLNLQETILSRLREPQEKNIIRQMPFLPIKTFQMLPKSILIGDQ